MGGTPSFSQPRQPTNQSRPQGTESGSIRGQSFRQPSESGSRPDPATAGASTATRANPRPTPGRRRGRGLLQPQPEQSPPTPAPPPRRGLRQPESEPAPLQRGRRRRRRGLRQPESGPAEPLQRRRQPPAGAGYANRNSSRTTPMPAPPPRARATPTATAAELSPTPGAAAAGAAYANHNQYNQYHPGMVNGYWNGNNSAAWGATGAGLGCRDRGRGLGHRLADVFLRLFGLQQSLLRRPAGGSQPARRSPATHPSRPRRPPTTTPSRSARPPRPPEPPVADQATSAFDQAREAFKAGDYANALQLVQQALAQTPNDTTLHEFLALVLFARASTSRPRRRSTRSCRSDPAGTGRP